MKTPMKLSDEISIIPTKKDKEQVRTVKIHDTFIFKNDSSKPFFRKRVKKSSTLMTRRRLMMLRRKSLILTHLRREKRRMNHKQRRPKWAQTEK